MGLTINHKHQLAKSFTELAIQNNLFDKYSDSEKTAENIAQFYDTIVNTIDKTTDEE